MSLTGIRLRSAVTQSIRDWLISRGFEELLPQLMGESQPLEPTIYPFVTKWNRQVTNQQQTSQQYLATSPEGYLKQAMATGSDHCFAISHAFRNLEGEGPIHRPEFLMVEWYEKNTDWQHKMQETQQLVMSVWEKCNPKNLPATSHPWATISIRDLWQQYLGVDLKTLLNETSMSTFAQEKGYRIENATWEQLFYQIVFNVIEPHFDANPFFLIDFPSRISPLAKPQTTDPEFCERFELFINRIELANGNTENTDVSKIQAMMENEQKLRQTSGEIQHLDHQFLTAVTKLQNHTWAGVGLGIDRLAMMIGNISSIQDIQQP